MALFYTIDDVKGHPNERDELPETARLIAFCSYWTDQASHDRGDPPLFRESHGKEVYAFINDFVRNPQGDRKRLDGVFVPEVEITPADEEIGWERQRVEGDVRQQLLDHLDHIAQVRETALPAAQADIRDPFHIEQSRDTDRHNVLQRQDVIDLRGTTRGDRNNPARNRG